MSADYSEKNVLIHIKWGKETLEIEIPIDFIQNKAPSSQIILSIQEAVYDKTRVPIQRQKLMCKAPKNLWKGLLKENDATIDWTKILPTAPTSAAAQFLLMGSAEDVAIAPPKTKTIFIEDMKEEEIASIADPAGLVNLGNTCYLNSVVQCLRVIPQFQSSLQTFRANQMISPSNPSTASTTYFTNALMDTLTQLKRQTAPLQPVTLVHATKVAFPQFAQTVPSTGHPMQQDAEEFYSQIVSTLSNQFMQPGSSIGGDSGSFSNNAIDSIFGIRLQETLTCDEFVYPTVDAASTAVAALSSAEPMEPPVVRYDLSRKLVCNIQGGSDGNQTSVNVNYINEGIKLGLTGKIVKHSSVLERDAVWTRTQQVVKLPQILVIQFGRFYWKATPDSADHTGVKCKIMKPVAFNDTLDIYDFCSKDLQAVMQQSRQKALALEEALIQQKLDGTAVATQDPETKRESTDEPKDDAMDESSQIVAEDDDDLKAALAMSMETSVSMPAAESTDEGAVFGPGIPNDFQGQYELFAVVTHKGRDADGGHYMAWVKSDHQSSSSDSKQRNQKIADTDIVNEDWYVFDDDEVSPCKTEDVLKLKGGGDWHMSYLNFYRVKK
jgi:ubiquitin carboxyl-terminal hydrolase 14